MQRTKQNLTPFEKYYNRVSSNYIGPDNYYGVLKEFFNAGLKTGKKIQMDQMSKRIKQFESDFAFQLEENDYFAIEKLKELIKGGKL